VIVLVALTVGLVFWITAWAFGVKSFDAFLVCALLTITAATYHVAKPFIEQLLGRRMPSPSER
jgi:hypothetical protein